MAEQPKSSDWVFVAAFYKKEEAQACFINLPREKGKKYEIQAVMFEDLAKDAAVTGCLIFMLDAEGRILLKINPATVD